MTLSDALHGYGLVTGDLIYDENIHRCGTTKKPRGKNGWYIVFDGGKAAVFGNWETGDGYEYWQNGELEPQDRQSIKIKISALNKKKEEDQEAKSQEAIDYIESCSRNGFSDYLKNKRIFPHGIRFDGNVIVLPLQDASGKIWSYQKIYGDGSKYFMPGGRTKGCYYLIAGRNINKDERVIVCEGFATGATIHQETGLPVFVALNAGNLKAVCDSIPFRNIIIAADNDKSGIGEKFAKQSGYQYVIPDVQGGDFNDIARESVRSFFIKTDEQHPGDQFMSVPGLVGEIADWITATAIRPQPILSIAAALSFVGMVKGHRVRGKTDLRTNLLVMAMAPTGGGKEHPQNAIKRLAKACGLQRHLMGEPVSGAGFLHSLQNSGNIGYMVMDEVGRYIGNLSGSGAGVHQREILDYMVKTFSCANGILMGREKAIGAKEPRIDIENPHFCCYGSTVYERFRDACGSTEVVDGFLNRWIVLESKDRPDRQKKVKFTPPPQSIIDKVQAIAAHSPYDSYGAPNPVEVEFTPEAWDVFCDYRDKSDAMVKTAPYPLNQLLNRTPEHIEKIAHTISEDGCTGIYDLKAAIAIVEFSNRCIAGFAGMISDNVQEKDFIKVREIIKDMKTANRSALLRRCQFVSGGAKRFSEIMDVLVDENIVARSDDNRKVIYRWIQGSK